MWNSFPSQATYSALKEVVSEQNHNLCGSVHLGDFSLAHTQLFFTFLSLSSLTLAVSSKRSKMEETKAVDQASPFEGGCRAFFLGGYTSVSCSIMFLIARMNRMPQFFSVLKSILRQQVFLSDLIYERKVQFGDERMFCV